MIEIKRKAQQTAQEGPGTPTEATGAKQGGYTQEAQTPEKRPLQPFTAIDGSNYRKAYRAICDFHERNNPPRPGDDGGAAYWEKASADMIAIAEQFKQDPFICDMLIAVYNELERQYKQMTGSGAA